MAVVEEAEGPLRDLFDASSELAGIEVAAVLGPRQTVASGPEASLEKLSLQCRELGIKARRLEVSHAFHSAQMDPILGPFGRALSGFEMKPPQLPMISNSNGERGSTEVATVEYWQRQLREPIRWTRCLDTLSATLAAPEPALLLEIGPGTALLGLAARHRSTASLARLPSLRQRRGPREQLFGSLGRLWQAGVAVNWNEVFHQGRQRLHLPTYPFQRQSYWLPGRAEVSGASSSPQRGVSGPNGPTSPPAARGQSPWPAKASHLVADPRQEPKATSRFLEDSLTPKRNQRSSRSPGESRHGLLGRRLPLPGLRDVVFESHYSLAGQPNLAGHRLGGEVVVAGASWVSVLMAAAHSLGWRTYALEDLHFARPLTLARSEERTVHLVLKPRKEGEAVPRSFEILSFPPGQGEAATVHVSGRMAPTPHEPLPPLDQQAVRKRCPVHIDGSEHYRHQEAVGLSLAAPFRRLAEAWLGDGEALARLETPAAQAPTASQPRPAREADAAGWLDGLLPDPGHPASRGR